MGCRGWQEGTKAAAAAAAQVAYQAPSPHQLHPQVPARALEHRRMGSKTLPAPTFAAPAVPHCLPPCPLPWAPPAAPPVRAAAPPPVAALCAHAPPPPAAPAAPPAAAREQAVGTADMSSGRQGGRASKPDVKSRVRGLSGCSPRPQGRPQAAAPGGAAARCRDRARRPGCSARQRWGWLAARVRCPPLRPGRRGPCRQGQSPEGRRPPSRPRCQPLPPQGPLQQRWGPPPAGAAARLPLSAARAASRPPAGAARPPAAPRAPLAGQPTRPARPAGGTHGRPSRAQREWVHFAQAGPKQRSIFTCCTLNAVH